MPVALKLCGINSVSAAQVVRETAAEYVGCVLGFPRSPRNVDPAVAGEIFRAAGATPVAVVVNPTVDSLLDLQATTGFAVVQLSGDESPALAAAFLERAPCQVWKTLHLPGAATEAEAAVAREKIAAYETAGVTGFVLDRARGAGARKEYGGTGLRPDWGLCAQLANESEATMILAGGLDSDCVAQAIAAVGPAVVDVSSGVESAPGVKDPEALRRFVAAVRGR